MPSSQLPICACGYNLTGLPGPPWRCPECGHELARWPPARSALALTPIERRVKSCSIAVILAGPILLPWVDDALRAGLVVLIGAAILALAVTVYHWLIRDEMGWMRLAAVAPFVVACALGIVSAAGMLLVGIVIRACF